MQINVPFYNVLNMLLTGLVFLGACVLMFPNLIDVVLQNPYMDNLSAGPEIVVTICFLAVAYETGLFINRLGSVVVETCLRKFTLIPFTQDYVELNRQRKEFPIIETLSREYVVSRTRIALCLALFLMAFIAKHWIIGASTVCGIILYYCSAYKHSYRIVELVEKNQVNQKRKAG